MYVCVYNNEIYKWTHQPGKKILLYDHAKIMNFGNTYIIYESKMKDKLIIN